MADGGIGNRNIAPPLEEGRTFEEASNLINMVKARFQGDDDHVYKSFLNIMKAYGHENKPVDKVYDKIKALFQDHGDLLAEFTRFLPASFRNSAKYIEQSDVENLWKMADGGIGDRNIAPPLEEANSLALLLWKMADGGIGDRNIAPPLEEAGPSRNEETFEEALKLINRIKARFQGDDNHVYKSFLTILNAYREENMPVDKFYDEVKALFQDHIDLFEEFTLFLPAKFMEQKIIKLWRMINGGIGNRNIAPPLEEARTFDEALNLINRVKARFQGDDDHVYKSFSNILKAYRDGNKPVDKVYDEVEALFEDHGDLLAEFHRFLPAYYTEQLIVKATQCLIWLRTLNIS